jgi:hypothetical protein
MSAGVTYDSGALIAAERNHRGVWALHMACLRNEIVPVVPAPVLAEVWRGGGRQANLSRLLSPCEVEDLTETNARAVGTLAGQANPADVVDAAVVEGALRRGDVVVTSDPADIEAIAAAAGSRLTVLST